MVIGLKYSNISRFVAQVDYLLTYDWLNYSIAYPLVWFASTCACYGVKHSLLVSSADIQETLDVRHHRHVLKPFSRCEDVGGAWTKRSSAWSVTCSLTGSGPISAWRSAPLMSNMESRTFWWARKVVFLVIACKSSSIAALNEVEKLVFNSFTTQTGFTRESTGVGARHLSSTHQTILYMTPQ